MRFSQIDKAKHIISKMMNDENDDHADLLADLISRVGNNSKLLDNLHLVHNTKIKLLEDILDRLKEIK
jgi:hypothetical protein